MTQMPLDPTAVVLVAAWIPLIAAGVGALGSWLSGRATSKQHQRQLASEERRQAMHQQMVARYMQQQEKARQAAIMRRQAMIRQLGGTLGAELGISPQMIDLMAQNVQAQPLIMPPGDYTRTQGMPAAQAYNLPEVTAAALGPQAQGDPTDIGLPPIPSWLGGPAAQPAPAAG